MGDVATGGAAKVAEATARRDEEAAADVRSEEEVTQQNGDEESGVGIGRPATQR